MIGPLSPEEKGYRYITGVRLFHIIELEEYAYPVGLGFIHSLHPKFKPSLTWLDLSHQIEILSGTQIILSRVNQ